MLSSQVALKIQKNQVNMMRHFQACGPAFCNAHIAALQTLFSIGSFFLFREMYAVQKFRIEPRTFFVMSIGAMRRLDKSANISLPVKT